MQGVKEIIPVQSLEEALFYKDKKGYIVAAERNAARLMDLIMEILLIIILMQM